MIPALLVLTALWIAPSAAHACAVCFSGSDETRWMFILTTAFMTGLPLLMIGGVVGWLFLRVRSARREELGYLPPRPAPGELPSNGRVRP